MTESFSIQSATRSQSPLTRRDVLNRFASTAAGVSIAGLLGAFTGSGVSRANTTIAPAVSSGVTRARLDQTAPANITLWLLPSDPIAQNGLIK